MNGARIKIDRMLGKDVVSIDSASRFVVIYRAGKIGVPAAALMYTNVGTFLFELSCAIETAIHITD
jgi:hypothetical protein